MSQTITVEAMLSHYVAIQGLRSSPFLRFGSDYGGSRTIIGCLSSSSFMLHPSVHVLRPLLFVWTRWHPLGQSSLYKNTQSPPMVHRKQRSFASIEGKLSLSPLNLESSSSYALYDDAAEDGDLDEVKWIDSHGLTRNAIMSACFFARGVG